MPTCKCARSAKSGSRQSDARCWTSARRRGCPGVWLVLRCARKAHFEQYLLLVEADNIAMLREFACHVAWVDACQISLEFSKSSARARAESRTPQSTGNEALQQLAITGVIPPDASLYMRAPRFGQPDEAGRFSQADHSQLHDIHATCTQQHMSPKAIPPALSQSSQPAVLPQLALARKMNGFAVNDLLQFPWFESWGSIHTLWSAQCFWSSWL